MRQTLYPNLKPETVRQVRMYKSRSESVNPADITNRVYHVCAQSEGMPGLNIGHGIKTLRFFYGHFFIDNIHVVLPRYMSDFMTWTQLTKSHYTSGHLHFTQGGTLITGIIALGTTKADAVTYHVIASYFPLVTPQEFAGPTAVGTSSIQTFTTQITKKRHLPTSDLTISDWQDGVTLGLGYDTVKGQIIQVNGLDISAGFTYTGDPNKLQIDLVDETYGAICEFGAPGNCPLKASIIVTMLNPTTFVGTVQTTCDDQNGYDPKNSQVYLWKGTTASGQAIAATPSKTAFLTTADLLTDPSLDVNTLAGYIPDSNNVNSMANTMLVENMKWAIAQDSTKADWLTLFYSENPPVLDASRKELINNSLDWYQNHYAKAQLGWQTVNYAGTNQPTTQLSDDKKLQLKYYLQTGIGTDKDFNIQQAGIYTEAYILSFKPLSDYLNDPEPDADGRTGGEKWAHALYDQLYFPNLGIAISAYKANSNSTPIHQKCSLLSVLQPSGTLAQTYLTSVIQGILNASVDTADFTNADSLMQWLPQWLDKFLQDIAADPSLIPEEGQIVAQQMNEFKQQQGGDMTKVALAMADILANAPSSSIWTACVGAEEAWANTYPKVSYAGRAFFLMAWGYGLSQIILAFGNWQNLTEEAKGKLVTATVSAAIEAMQLIPDILTGISVTVMEKWIAWRASKVSIVDDVGGSIAQDWVQVGLDETTPLVDAETKTIVTEGTLWARVFNSKVVQVVLKGVAIIVAVAVAVFSFIDFAKDLQSGQPIARTVLDGFMAAANFAVAVCVVVEVVLSSVIASVVGTVFAILGAIIAIIEMFIVKPANPLEVFMEQVVVPFVDGLPAQNPPPTGGSATPTVVVFA